MGWKEKDWIEHPKFGVGQVREIRGDKLDIHFLSDGKKTLQASTDLSPAAPPNADFKFPHETGKRRTGQFKVQPPKHRLRLNFDHLVDCFSRRFPQGFEGNDFHKAEREYKLDAAAMLEEKLGREAYQALLDKQQFADICTSAIQVLRSTNLVFRIEKAKFKDAVIDTPANQEPFAKQLFDLLYGSGEMEHRFTAYCDLLSVINADKWTLATYFQFLLSHGKWMFMKPAVMKPMADSLNVALNYKTEPNWLTYSKLGELADRVREELEKRGLKPHSGIDVQGFIWTAIEVEAGKYGVGDDGA